MGARLTNSRSSGIQLPHGGYPPVGSPRGGPRHLLLRLLFASLAGPRGPPVWVVGGPERSGGPERPRAAPSGPKRSRAASRRLFSLTSCTHFA